MKNESFELCYPILESNKNNFIKKINSIKNDDISLLELRIDYLLNGKLPIDEIVNLINQIKIDYKTILTIRTKREGGEIKVNNDEYRFYITKIFDEVNSDLIDIEYQYYVQDVDFFNRLFKNKSKKIIISEHEFNKTYTEKEYIIKFEKMINSNADIIKYAIKVNTKEELFEYMMAAKKCNGIINKCKKKAIFIAMGEMGKLSRIWPEFTGSKVVFLTAYKNANKLGQFTYESFVKIRNLLEKIVKN